jgi:hypothetical protein
VPRPAAVRSAWLGACGSRAVLQVEWVWRLACRAGAVLCCCWRSEKVSWMAPAWPVGRGAGGHCRANDWATAFDARRGFHRPRSINGAYVARTCTLTLVRCEFVLTGASVRRKRLTAMSAVPTTWSVATAADSFEREPRCRQVDSFTDPSLSGHRRAWNGCSGFPPSSTARVVRLSAYCGTHLYLATWTRRI